jgi:hypothetical protein
MKRRSFIQHSAILAGAASFVPPLSAAGRQTPPGDKDIYELRIYQLISGGTKAQVKNYITSAIEPFIGNIGGKTGIFSEYSLQEPPKLYVLFTYPSPEAYYRCITEMEIDATYQANAAAYLQSAADKPMFERYETILLEAFDAIPHFRQPDPARGLFELRIYESYNEDAGRRKIRMFNKDELILFDKIGLPPVFFGKILAGTHMPALTYMLWFRDMAHREEVWTKFRSHPEWTAMRDKPEYANAVSKVNKIFLLPEEGSQI